MKRVISKGIIYKFIKYSDSSAIAFCFFKDYGKLKLFINRAFSKKKGINKFLPADIDFQKKEDSDLHKSYNINYNTSFTYLVENPEIFIRLNIIFNIIDNLYHDEEKDETLFKYLLSINNNNLYRSSIYITNYILKQQGIYKDFKFCEKCGKELENLFLSDENFVCEKCLNGKKYLGKKEIEILSNVFQKEFKSISLTIDQEIKILEFLAKYIENLTKKKINGLEILKELS